MPEGAVPLYIDECVHSKVAEALRNANYDVIGAHEVQAFSSSDPAQLAYATSEGRAIVTYNAGHFVALHSAWLAQGRAHAGIIVSPRDYKQAVGEFVRDLRATLRVHADMSSGVDGWIWNRLLWIRPPQ